jgi:phytoene dehydrogenase-like protein
MSKVSSVPFRQTFDVLVLGSQLAGAVAGALLAKRGLRVLAVEHGGGGGAYEQDGWLLPDGPNLLPSLRPLPAVTQVLDELGLNVELGRRLTPLHHGLQVLAPDARFDLHGPGPARQAELAREFGEVGHDFGQAIEDFIQREEHNGPFFDGTQPLPPVGLFEGIRLRRAASSRLQLTEPKSLLTPTSHPLARAMKELWRLSNNLVEEESLPEPNVVSNPARAALRPLAHWLRGAYTLPGGLAGLAATLRHRIESSGGAVIAGEESIVDEVSITGKVASLRLVSSANEYRARVVISAIDGSALRELIPPAASQGRLTQSFDAVRIRSQLFTLNLVLAPGAVPPGFGSAAVCLPQSSPKNLFMQIHPVQREGRPAEGHSVLQLCAQVPSQTLTLGDDGMAKLRTELRESAEEFFPFIDGYVLLESAPSMEQRSAGPPPRLHPRFEIARKRVLGVTGLPLRTPLRNLVRANREVLPGLGLEGEFLCGVRAAALVARMVHKADPLS